jgi:hypothetical protein
MICEVCNSFSMIATGDTHRDFRVLRFAFWVFFCLIGFLFREESAMFSDFPFRGA